MDPPVWLNEEFLSAVLEKDVGRVNVIKFDCTPAVTKGNNYFSTLFRVSVEFMEEEDCETAKTVSLIVKIPETDNYMKGLAEKMKVVEKEVLAYKELMPEFHRKLKDDMLTPRSLYSPRDDVLVLEDLKEKGYIMCNRLEQLDHDHCVNVMTTLAKFHASSVALYETRPELIEEAGRKYVFTEDIAQENRDFFFTMFERDLTSTANALNTFDGYEHFSQKVIQQIGTLWDRMLRMSTKKKYVKVLNHGDLWTNNIMFKHDELGKVVDVRLIDLQVCKYATPGIDIQTFLVSSANADVREHGYSDLINVYRETFNSTLCDLNSKFRLSAEELEEEIRYADIQGFLAVCTLVPMVFADPKNPPKLSEKYNGSENFDPDVMPTPDMYFEDRYRKVLINCLETLQVNGFFKKHWYSYRCSEDCPLFL